MRKLILGCLVLVMCASSPVFAQMKEADLITTLKAQGYVVTERKRTLLGRISLELENETHEREIIFNPSNGLVLRDYSELKDDEHGENSWLDHIFGISKGNVDDN